MPEETDIPALARALRVPVNTLRAVRHLALLPRAAPMLTTLSAWRYMIDSRSSRLVMIGTSMLLGIGPLRDLTSPADELLVSLLDPAGAALATIERSPQGDGFESGSMRAYWLASALTLRVIARRTPSVRVVLSTHPLEGVLLADGRRLGGQLVANDWLAIHSEAPPHESPTFTVYLLGDEGWERLVVPAIQALTRPEATLWDSTSSGAGEQRLSGCLESLLRDIRTANAASAE